MRAGGMVCTVGLVLVVGLSAAAHWSSLNLGPVGQDTVILAASSRADSAGAWGRRWGQELRQSIRPSTAFYRPLVNSSFAIDRVVDHDSWRQLHRTSVAWHAAATGAFFLLLLRLGFSPLWAWGGAIAFGLHPLAIEVVPAPARRAESMVVALISLACVAWPEGSSRSRRIIAIALAALAPLAKECAFVLPLLWAALPSGSTWWRRAAWGVVAVLPALLLRTAVLGGGGGYVGWSLEFHGLFDAMLDLFDPFRLLSGWGARILWAVVVAMAIWSWRRRSPSSSGVRFAGAWIAASLALLTLADGIAAWYLYMPLVGAILLMMTALRGAWELLPGGRRWAVVAVGFTLVFVGLRPSPLWTDYPEWEWIGAESSRLLSAASGLAVEGLDAFHVAGLPREAYAWPRRRFAVRSATGVVDDTLRSWWRDRRGIDLPVVSYADLALLSPRTRPTRAVVDEQGTLRLMAPPGSKLLPPKWPAAATVEFRAHGSSARVVNAGEGLWLWTGGEFLWIEP